MRIVLIALCLLIWGTAHAQLITNPLLDVKLEIEQESGTNATAVVYHPKYQYYYTFFAGNSNFPLEVFQRDGTLKFAQNVGVDMRGAWWNPKSQKIEANLYASGLWARFELDAEGKSMGSNSIDNPITGKPHLNSVAAYDGRKYVYYYDAGKVYCVHCKKGKVKYIQTVDFSSGGQFYMNNTTVLYTGVKGMEIGLLDFWNRQLLLLNKKTLEITGRVNIPCNDSHREFRLAYANKRVFLYSAVNRTWYGFRIFR